MRSDIEINNLAIKLRKSWGEDEYSYVDVFGRATMQDNMTIITMAMPNAMSGMCIKTGKEVIIAINSSMSLGRQRFTLSHELYHAYYDDTLATFVCMKTLGGKKSDSEKEADQFASFLLAPYSALDSCQGNSDEECWDIKRIIFAEHYYGISHQTLLFRLFSENRISQAEYNEFKEMSVTSISEKMGLPVDLYLSSSKLKPYSCTGSYLRKVQEAYDRGLISEGKMRELMSDGFADYDNRVEDLIID